MKGADFQIVRESLDLSRKDFGRLLGYSGEEDNIYQTVQRYESGKRPIPPTLARLVYLLWTKRGQSLDGIFPQTIDEQD